MQYTTLGSSGIRVSVVALGCWPFAGGKVWGDQDDDVSIATAHAALDAGITLFDSAEGYEAGHSERVLGRALVGRRDRAVIATKVSPNHLAPDDIVEACERSLRNLQTDYIDLYQIHWPNHDLPLSDAVEALEKLKQQGKIRAIGVSNFGVQDLTEMLSLGECVTNQMAFNLLWRGIEDAVLPLCVENAVGILCYSTLAQGLLTGRYANADEVPDGLSRSRLFSSTRPMAIHEDPGCEAEVFASLERVRQIAEQLGVSDGGGVDRVGAAAARRDFAAGRRAQPAGVGTESCRSGLGALRRRSSGSCLPRQNRSRHVWAVTWTCGRRRLACDSHCATGIRSRFSEFDNSVGLH